MVSVSYNHNIYENDYCIPSITKSHSRIISLNASVSDRQGAKYHNIHAINKQKWHKRNKMLIISPAYTCAKPNAMMIKFHNTIVAYITMGCALGSKYHAGLTKLKPINHILISVQIMDTLLLWINVHILEI